MTVFSHQIKAGGSFLYAGAHNAVQAAQAARGYLSGFGRQD
jgi:hypothetical protein